MSKPRLLVGHSVQNRQTTGPLCTGKRCCCPLFQGTFSHSTGTAPIIAVFIPGNPLKTTHLQKRTRTHVCAHHICTVWSGS